MAQINEHIKPSNSQETLKKASSPIQNQSIFQNPAIEKNPIIGGIVNNSKPAEIKKKITMKLSTNSQSFYAGNNLENPAAEKKNEKIEKIEENNNSYNEIKSNKDLEKKLENIEKENKEMEEMLKNNSLKEIRENQKKEENLKKEGNDKKQLIIKKEEVEELKKQEEILKIQEETLKKQKILEEEKKIEEIIIPEKRLYKPFIKNIIEVFFNLIEKNDLNFFFNL